MTMEYPNGPEHLPQYQGYFRAARHARSAEVYRLAGLVKRSLLTVSRAVIAVAASGLRRVERNRQLRAAQRELERMDDHMLSDLGITRDDIANVVRNGKSAPDAGHEVRHPHEAKRAAEVVELRRGEDVMGALIVHGPWSRYSGQGARRDDAA
jgi:uncharacterized protein YjiS (DUF1127 family)